MSRPERQPSAEAELAALLRAMEARALDVAEPPLETRRAEEGGAAGDASSAWRERYSMPAATKICLASGVAR